MRVAADVRRRNSGNPPPYVGGYRPTMTKERSLHYQRVSTGIPLKAKKEGGQNG